MKARNPQGLGPPGSNAAFQVAAAEVFNLLGIGAQLFKLSYRRFSTCEARVGKGASATATACRFQTGATAGCNPALLAGLALLLWFAVPGVHAQAPFADITNLISREVTLFIATGPPEESKELVSRECSLFIATSPVNEVKELVSRECTLFIATAPVTAQQELVSREMTLFIGGEPATPLRELASREVSVVVATPQKPALVTQLVVNPVPARQSATLSWAGYNEWAERDIIRYDIYMLSRRGDGSTRLTLANSVPAGTFSITFNNLPAEEEHFFAVVAVDALGQYTPAGSLRTGRYAGGLFSLFVDNPLGAEFVLLESPDLMTWVMVQTNTASAMPCQMTVTNTPGLNRFYRVLIQ
jgi:hypothetical protein